MSYRITLRNHHTYKTFIISVKAAGIAWAKMEAYGMYPDCSIIAVNPIVNR